MAAQGHGNARHRRHSAAAFRHAVNAGAHAVYCGYRDETNARNFPGLNFSHAEMREAIAYADSVHDYVSRDMMIEILADEEGHIDWLETELDLIGKIGLQNYLQSQIKVSD